MKFDLYDFDKTVFPVDSESVFYIFCLVRRPWLIVFLPYQLVCLACFFLKIGGDRMKGRFFCFLRFVNTEKMVKNSGRKTKSGYIRFPSGESRPPRSRMLGVARVPAAPDMRKVQGAYAHSHAP